MVLTQRQLSSPINRAHPLSTRTSADPINSRDPKCSISAFQKSPSEAQQGSDGAARQSEVKAEGILLLRTKERKAIVIDPLPCPMVRMPHIHLQTFFWVTRYGTPILQCKDYVTLPCTGNIKKVENKRGSEGRGEKWSPWLSWVTAVKPLHYETRQSPLKYVDILWCLICSRNKVQQQCTAADCHYISTDYTSFE